MITPDIRTRIIGFDPVSGAEEYIDTVVEPSGDTYEIHGWTTNEKTIAYYNKQVNRIRRLFRSINAQLSRLEDKGTHHAQSGWKGMNYDMRRNDLFQRYDALVVYRVRLDMRFQVECSLREQDVQS